eukprot:6193409-Pleurochrysis_carterae.AAC.1
MQAITQGVLNGRLGDLTTAAEAKLFSIFAILSKAQAQQDMGQYGNGKVRILITLDCPPGLRVIEKEIAKWSGARSHYECKRNPGNDNIATQKQEETPEGMVTGLICKQVKSIPIINNGKVMGHEELADSPTYQAVRRRGKRL